jgi:hypothetical protein
MKDFNTTQKLLMAFAVLAAVTFAVLVAVPADAVQAAPVHTAAGMSTPF